MRVNAVAIKPDERGFVILGGENNQGKTSILDAIWVTLGGAKAIKQTPVKRGQERALLVIELSNGLTITRTIEQDRTTKLTVEAKDGSVYKSPQAMLDALIGSISFDPMAFVNMEGKRRLKVVQELVGLNFDEHDARYQKLYDERTGAGRILDRLKGIAEAFTLIPNVPTDEVSTQPLLDEIQSAQSLQVEKVTKIGQASNQDNTAKGLKAQAHDLELEIEQKKRRLKLLQDNAKAAEAEAAALTKQANAITVPDVTPVRAKLAEVQALNEQVRHNQKRAGAVKEADDQHAIYAGLTEQIEALDREKKRLIAGAKFPVPGMGFGTNDITFNDLPMDQASGAEKIRMSMAVGIALSKDIKVIPLRDAALLSKTNLQVVLDMCAEHGIQPWIERVDEGAEVTVVIEDGGIKEVRSA